MVLRGATTINISTEHEGRGDIIKMVLEGFDPKLAGVLVTEGASKPFHVRVENSVK